MTVFWTITNGLATFVMAFSAAYFFLTLGLGLKQLRRSRVSLGFQSNLSYGRPFAGLEPSLAVESLPESSPGSSNRLTTPTGQKVVFFLIACLNEQAVISQTIHGLLDPCGSRRIIIVDDASDDATGEVACQAGGEQVIVVRRELPDGRQGKGAALNAGFAVLLAEVQRQALDPDNVVVCVMDADGKLSNGSLAAVLPLFDDPKLGGVQLAVRIRNRRRNFLLRFQDYQFWSQSALTQFGRIQTSSVSLGGNGQFARLSALMELGSKPWSGSLTEDLDLTVSLTTRGWNTSSTPHAAVDQQGVETFRALLKQRTRWYQGHMLTSKRIPEVLKSSKISHSAAVEMTLYILVPWIFDLPWSVLYHLVLLELVLASGQFLTMSWEPLSIAIYFVVLYLLGFWPAIVTAIIAYRRDPTLRMRGAFNMGHAFVITNYLSYLCVWRALWRILRQQNGWTKTARSLEPVSATSPVPL